MVARHPRMGPARGARAFLRCRLALARSRAARQGAGAVSRRGVRRGIAGRQDQARVSGGRRPLRDRVLLEHVSGVPGRLSVDPAGSARTRATLRRPDDAAHRPRPRRRRARGIRDARRDRGRPCGHRRDARRAFRRFSARPRPFASAAGAPALQARVVAHRRRRGQLAALLRRQHARRRARGAAGSVRGIARADLPALYRRPDRRRAHRSRRRTRRAARILPAAAPAAR